jgi:hypothetical protein
MKRMFVALAMLPMLAQAAELNPGTIEVTGGSNLGLEFGSVDRTGATEKTKTTDFGLDLTGLYYVTKNIGVGLNAGYAFSSEKLGDAKDTLSALLIGPAVGFDYAVAPKASVFGIANVGYASGKLTEDDGVDEIETKTSGFGFGLAAGAKYFLTNSFSLNGSVGYDWLKLTNDDVTPEDETTVSGFGVDVGLSVYF